MRVKHIVIFVRSLPIHNIGGMEMVAWDLAIAFKEKGIKVSCITTSLPEYNEKFNLNGIDIIALKGSKTGQYSKNWFKYSTNYFIEYFSKEKDIVVLSVSAGAAGLINRKNEILDIPIIFQAHGTSMGEIKSKFRTLKLKAIASSILNVFWLFKDMMFYPKGNAIVSVGDKVYKDLTNFPYNIFFQKEKIYLIRNGVNSKIFKYDVKIRGMLRSKHNINNNTKVIISVSRLHKQKGVHLSLAGFAKYLQKNSNSLYIIIGDGVEKENLIRLSKELDILDKVLFLGSLEREELAKYLSVADIFLFTTLRDEGLPLNALEALASGLKVLISSHIEGIIKISKKGVKAINPNSLNNIVQALDSISNDKRESYLPIEYTLDYCTNKYIEVMEKL